MPPRLSRAAAARLVGGLFWCGRLAIALFALSLALSFALVAFTFSEMTTISLEGWTRDLPLLRLWFGTLSLGALVLVAALLLAGGSPSRFFRLGDDLRQRRIASADGTIDWRGKGYAATIPGRARPARAGFGSRRLENVRPGPYRFSYLPSADYLISVRSLVPTLAAHESGEATASDALLRTLAAVHGFQTDALEVNRAGRLTPEQSRAVARQVWRAMPGFVVFGLSFIAGGGGVVFGPARQGGIGEALFGLLFVAIGGARSSGGLGRRLPARPGRGPGRSRDRPGPQRAVPEPSLPHLR